MSLTIQLSPRQQNRLAEDAARKGLLLHDYVVAKLLADTPSTPADSMSFEDWMAAFDTWSLSHRTDTPVPPPEALERDALYEGRL